MEKNSFSHSKSVVWEKVPQSSMFGHLKMLKIYRVRAPASLELVHSLAQFYVTEISVKWSDRCQYAINWMQTNSLNSLLEFENPSKVSQLAIQTAKKG